MFHFLSPNPTGDIEEWCIVELQGDLEVRGDRLMDGQFIGDLLYNKYGQPVSSIFSTSSQHPFIITKISLRFS